MQSSKGISQMSIAEMSFAMRNKNLTCVEITTHFIRKIKDSDINAFINFTFDEALESAAHVDSKISNGEELKPLEGIPIGIKDNFCTKNVETTACSKMLQGFVPTYESVVTERLQDAGMISLGKLNMDEFAMGSTTSLSAYGPTLNPWNKTLVTGGSSGGSAAAVSAGLCPIALGSDTGGSVRQPAAFCGTVGVKPTYGRCPRWGMIAFASSLDQAGVFAKNVHDAAVITREISGYSAKDTSSLRIPKLDLGEDFEKYGSFASPKNKKVGVLKPDAYLGLQPEISILLNKGREWLESEGIETVEISLNNIYLALTTYYVIACAEASSNLARYDGIRYGKRRNLDSPAVTRALYFGEEVKKRILMGTYVLSSECQGNFYQKALKIKADLKSEFNEIFSNVSAVLSPVTPTEAFPLSENCRSMDMYANDLFTIPASLAGLPAISVPCGFSDNNLPLGLQLVSNHCDEVTMFYLASLLEKKSPEISLYDE